MSQGATGDEAGGMLASSALFSLGQYLPFKRSRESQVRRAELLFAVCSGRVGLDDLQEH